jgi:plasmid stability protein
VAISEKMSKEAHGMTELRIRNVDEWIVDIHRHNAKQNGVSLESEIKRILCDAAFEKRRATAKKLKELRDEMREKYGEFPSSVGYIRDMREGRE